jgi:acetyl esterase/lipase
MKPEKILLWDQQAPVGDGSFQEADAAVTVFRPRLPNGAAVVICPGGGYAKLVMEAEGNGIARWLNQHGITGIVLEYRLPQGKPFAPLLDAQRAIRLVRSRAKEWSLDPAKIGIMGFSAGGHVASTVGTHFDRDYEKKAVSGDPVSSRPDFMVLIYPLISMEEKAHLGSRANLLGQAPASGMIGLFSNEKQVTDKTPPAYLAHAKDDEVVSPDHSRMFYEALKAHGVQADYLELPDGGHGLNGYKGLSWEAWKTGSLQWLAQLGFIRKEDAVAGAH